LTNILSNAIKFCPEENGQIAIEVHENEEHLLVSVRDNGIGVDEHDTKRIFEKFYQSENQNLKKPIGSGLGLAICKNIIQLHGGIIWIENNENQGATVTFTLPKTNEL